MNVFSTSSRGQTTEMTQHHHDGVLAAQLASELRGPPAGHQMAPTAVNLAILFISEVDLHKEEEFVCRTAASGCQVSQIMTCKSMRPVKWRCPDWPDSLLAR